MNAIAEQGSRILELMEPKSAAFASWSQPIVYTGEASTTQSSSSVVTSKDGSFNNGHGGSSDSALKEHDYIGMAEVSSARPATDDDSANSTGLKLADDDADTDLRLSLTPLKEDVNNPRVQAPVELELLGPKETKDSACSDGRSPATPKGAHMAVMNVFSPAAMVPQAKNGIKRVYREVLGDSAPNANNQSTATGLGSKQTQGSESKTIWAVPNQKNSETEPPPAKDRVVGWPPIRSYRKNTLASANAGHAGEGESQSTIYVKVNMDGIPIGRKVDLNAYRSYDSLLSALEEMFHSPSSGHGLHFLTNSEFVLTYEDKEGDWMLVGDVPWGMFVNTVRRLRIVRPSEATGVAPRAAKCHV